MPSLSSANFVNAIPKLVATDALDALLPTLVLGNLVNRDYEPMLQNYGDTVNVPIPPTLVANNLVETGQVQPQNPSLGNAQIVLNTHAEATFVIPDVTKAITAPDLIKTYMTPAVNALAVKIETDLMNLYPMFTYNAPVGSASAMDESRVDLAETSLFNALVPQGETLYMVTSGTAYGQLRQVERFTEERMNLGGSAINTGTLAAKVKNFIVVRSQLVQKPSSTTYNIAFARNAMSLAIRRLPLPMPGTGAVGAYAERGNFGLRVIMSYQPNTLSQQFTVDVFYGVGVLRQSFGVQVLSN